jgi:hypothetical protein
MMQGKRKRSAPDDQATRAGGVEEGGTAGTAAMATDDTGGENRLSCALTMPSG